MEIIRQFKAARRAGVPLVAVETADPANLIRTITDAMNGSKDEKVLVQWDIMRGATPINECGQKWLNEAGSGIQPGDPCTFLAGLQAMPKSGLAFLFAAHAMLRDKD